MTQLRFHPRPVVKQYDSFFNDFFNLPSAWSNPSRDVASIPATNVTETPNAYQLEISAPGRNKEDFNISLDKDLLTISFEKKAENKQEGANSIRREFSFNSFKRSFTLDNKIDASNIQARYESGVLKIDLPKKEEVKNEPKLIAVS